MNKVKELLRTIGDDNTKKEFIALFGIESVCYSIIDLSALWWGINGKVLTYTSSTWLDLYEEGIVGKDTFEDTVQLTDVKKSPCGFFTVAVTNGNEGEDLLLVLYYKKNVQEIC